MTDPFNYLAFVVLVILVLGNAAIVVLLGALPGNIARSRGHKYADAVTAAGWMGIATLGLLWPLAFVWAFMSPANDPQSRSA